MIEKHNPESKWKATGAAFKTVIAHEKNKRMAGQKSQGLDLSREGIASEVGATGAQLTRFLIEGKGMDEEAIQMLPKAIGYPDVAAVMKKAAELGTQRDDRAR